jgi:hypothetical protein
MGTGTLATLIIPVPSADQKTPAPSWLSALGIATADDD